MSSDFRYSLLSLDETKTLYLHDKRVCVPLEAAGVADEHVLVRVVARAGVPLAVELAADAAPAAPGVEPGILVTRSQGFEHRDYRRISHYSAVAMAEA
jgi:hypothetical protein